MNENERISKIADERNYRVKLAAHAKKIVVNRLKNIQLDNAVFLGLPEIDDRYHIWIQRHIGSKAVGKARRHQSQKV